jgi:hypothetical protein
MVRERPFAFVNSSEAGSTRQVAPRSPGGETEGSATGCSPTRRTFATTPPEWAAMCSTASKSGMTSEPLRISLRRAEVVRDEVNAPASADGQPGAQALKPLQHAVVGHLAWATRLDPLGRPDCRGPGSQSKSWSFISPLVGSTPAPSIPRKASGGSLAPRHIASGCPLRREPATPSR